MNYKPQSLLPSQLPRHRPALHDGGNLSTKLAIDDRSPRDRVNSWDLSMIANFPLDSCTVPANAPLTVSPSAAARSGTSRGSHGAGARSVMSARLA